MTRSLVADFAGAVAAELPAKPTQANANQALGVFLGATVLVELLYGSDDPITHDFMAAVERVKRDGISGVKALAKTKPALTLIQKDD